MAAFVLSTAVILSVRTRLTDFFVRHLPGSTYRGRTKETEVARVVNTLAGVSILLAGYLVTREFNDTRKSHLEPSWPGVRILIGIFVGQTVLLLVLRTRIVRFLCAHVSGEMFRGRPKRAEISRVVNAILGVDVLLCLYFLATEFIG